MQYYVATSQYVTDKNCMENSKRAGIQSENFPVAVYR